jgi:aspartate/methionine/tyrosine aminotransferase
MIVPGRFQPVEYIRWAKTVPGRPGELNLSSSGVAPCPLREEELGAPAEWFRLAGRNAYGHGGFLDWVAARYGVDREQVLLAQGASMANFLVLAGLVHPGDRVVLEDPRYEPLERAAAAVGAEVRHVPLDGPAGPAGLLDRVLEGVRRERVRLVLLSDLQNPTGAAWDRSALETLIEACEAAGAWVLVDEIYLEYLEPAARPPACRLGGHVVSTSSLTKAYGLGSLRAGWAVGPADAIRAAREANDAMSAVAPYCAEHLAWSIVSRPSLWAAVRDRARRQIAENRARVLEFLEAHPEIDLPLPAGGAVGFGRWAGHDDVDQWTEELRATAGVVVTPGRFFRRRDRFRLGWGADPREVAEGLSRFSRFLRARRPTA